MSAVAARMMGPSKSLAWPGAVVAILCAVCVSNALAFDDDLVAKVAAPSTATAGDVLRQFEISASSLPRFDNTDGSNRSLRLDMAWMPPGAAGLGLSLGVVNTMKSPSMFTTMPRTGNGPSIDLGLRWRYAPHGNNRVDVTAWRRQPQPDALTLIKSREATYGARVEMQISPGIKRGFVADHRFLGLQLESGARVGLRKNGRAPMVYYRSKF